MQENIIVSVGCCTTVFKLQALLLEQATHKAWLFPFIGQGSVDMKQKNGSSHQASQQHFQMATLTEVSLTF